MHSHYTPQHAGAGEPVQPSPAQQRSALLTPAASRAVVACTWSAAAHMRPHAPLLLIRSRSMSCAHHSTSAGLPPGTRTSWSTAFCLQLHPLPRSSSMRQLHQLCLPAAACSIPDAPLSTPPAACSILTSRHRVSPQAPAPLGPLPSARSCMLHSRSSSVFHPHSTSSGFPPGTSIAMLFPLSRIWSSLVTRLPSGVISISVTSSSTMLT